MAEPNPHARTIHADSTLMQDVVSGGWLEVAPGDAKVTLFANPFNAYAIEALVIGADSILRHAYRTAAGWETTPVPAPNKQAVHAVVATTTPDGGVWAMWSGEQSTVPCALTGARSWTLHGGAELTGASRLRTTYPIGLPAQRPVVYAWNATGSLLVYLWVPEGPMRPKDSPWMLLSGTLGLPVNDLVLTPTGSPVIHDAYFEATLFRSPPDRSQPTEVWRVSSSTTQLSFAPGPKIAVPNLTLVDGSAGEGIVLGIAGEKLSLYSLMSRPPGRVTYVQPTVDTACTQAQAAIDAYGLAHVYMLGADRVLSVLHQTGWEVAIHNQGWYPAATWARAKVDATNPPQLRTIALPLETDVARFSVLTHPDHTAVMIQRTDLTWELMTQDRASGAWTRESIEVRPQVSIRVTSYRTQLTLLDANGTPVAGEVLKVTSDELVQARFGDHRALIGPGLVHGVVTDARGRATVVTPAFALSAPVLSVTATGVNNGRVVRADAKLHAYLGQAGDLPLRPRFSGPVLEAATVGPNGDRVIPPDTWKRVDANQLVASLGTVYAAVAAPPGEARGGFVLQLYDPTRPALRTIESEEELAAELAVHRAHPAYGGVLESAQDFFGDVWEGVRRVGAVMKDAVVAVHAGVVTLIVKLGDAFVELGKLVLRTLRDAADVVMAVFTTLAAPVVKAVEWLASSFRFDHTWNTMLAFEDGFGKLVPSLQGALAEVNGQAIIDVITNSELQVLGDIEAKKLAYLGRSLQDLAPPRVAPGPTAAPGGTPLPARADVDGAYGSWFFDLISPLARDLPAIDGAASLEDLWKRAVATIGTGGEAFVAALREAWAKLAQTQPRDFVRVAVSQLCDLFSGVVRGVFGFVRDVVQRVLELVTAAVAAIPRLLAAKLTSPPLVELVNWVARQANADAVEAESVSLGRLAGLVIAFPLTLGWKLARGADAQPFPHGKLEAAVGAADGEPNPWGLTAGILQLLYGCFDAANDALPADAPPLAGLFVSLTALVLEVLILIFTFPNPNGTPFVFVPSTDPTRHARNAHFAAYFTICALDAISFAAGTDLKPSEPMLRLMRQREKVGKVLVTGAGVSAFAFGIWESVQTDVTVATFATNLFTPLSPAFQWLRWNPEDPRGLKAKLVADLFADGVGGAFRIGAAYGF